MQIQIVERVAQHLPGRIGPDALAVEIAPADEQVQLGATMDGIDARQADEPDRVGFALDQIAHRTSIPRRRKYLVKPARSTSSVMYRAGAPRPSTRSRSCRQRLTSGMSSRASSRRLTTA